jgi:hypothetical protein
MALKFKTIYVQNRCDVISPHCTQIVRHTVCGSYCRLRPSCVTSACATLQLSASDKVPFKYLARTKAADSYHHGVRSSTSLRVGAVCCNVIRVGTASVQCTAALSWPVTRSRQTAGTKYVVSQSKSVFRLVYVSSQPSKFPRTVALCRIPLSVL